jgi:hypothetical protein
LPRIPYPGYVNGTRLPHPKPPDPPERRDRHGTNASARSDRIDLSARPG